MAAPSSRRLDQILANLGYCSRRSAREFLKRHTVTVNGDQVRQTAVKVDPRAVQIDGEALDHPEGLFIRMHKPAGYVCSHEAREGASIYHLLPPRWLTRNPRPESVGRLDKDTTGVLIITDDGQLNHRWTSPQHHVEKCYRVSVDRPLSAELGPAFGSGELQLEGEEKPCLPASLSILEPQLAELVLTEGRYHQVKRMFAHFGYDVLALHRLSFGPYSAEDLEPGEWADLPPPETA